MITQEEQWVREAIKELCRIQPLKTNCPKREEHYDPFVYNPFCLDCFVDKLLCFTYPNGQPMIGILAEDQSYCCDGTSTEFDKWMTERCKEGWRKCLP